MVNATVEVIHTYRLFAPSTGAGYVAYKKPDYAHALSRSDTDLLMLLFETGRRLQTGRRSARA